MIPHEYLDLFEKPAFGHLATLMTDGSPQVTPVWIDYDGAHLLINTARGRLKDRNMQRYPQVAVDILDPDNPYRYVAVRGTVVEVIEDDHNAHINALTQRYLGYDKFPWFRAGQVRVIYKVRIDHVNGQAITPPVVGT